MHRKQWLALGVASSLFCSTGALAGATISTNTAPGVNFSAYKTYSWVSTTNGALRNPVLAQQLIADFDQALAGLGYVKAESGGDLSLVLTTGAQSKTDIESWGRFGLQTSVYQYTEGQLSLDAFDTKTQRALWHGQASDTVNPQKPNTRAIDAAVNKLMLKFPATAAVAPTASKPPQN
jgi:hypothetical protein